MEGANMNAQQKKEAIKTIKRLWNKCEYVLNNKTWTRYAEELLKTAREESKNHDRFRGESINRGLTITEESKFFALKRLLEYVYFEELQDEQYPPRIPDLDDYHRMQKSVFLAYSLGVTYAEELKAVATFDEARYISRLDYCELIKED